MAFFIGLAQLQFGMLQIYSGQTHHEEGVYKWWVWIDTWYGFTNQWQLFFAEGKDIAILLHQNKSQLFQLMSLFFHGVGLRFFQLCNEGIT